MYNPNDQVAIMLIFLLLEFSLEIIFGDTI